MRRGRTAILLAWLLSAAVAWAGKTNWLREVEIKVDPEEDGKKIYSFRFMPDRTLKYDFIEFECFYRQEFPWEDVRGRKYTKIHEPVTFTYRCKNIRLVNDLDAYIHFRVPTSRKRLVKIHGEKAFNKEAPITVNRFRITGKAGKKVIWNLVLAAGGKFDTRALTEEHKEEKETGEKTSAGSE